MNTITKIGLLALAGVSTAKRGYYCPSQITFFEELKPQRFTEVWGDFGIDARDVESYIDTHQDGNAPEASFQTYLQGSGGPTIVFQETSGKVVDCLRTMKTIFKRYHKCKYIENSDIVKKCKKSNADVGVSVNVSKNGKVTVQTRGYITKDGSKLETNVEFSGKDAADAGFTTKTSNCNGKKCTTAETEYNSNLKGDNVKGYYRGSSQSGKGRSTTTGSFGSKTWSG